MLQNSRLEPARVVAAGGAGRIYEACRSNCSSLRKFRRTLGSEKKQLFYFLEDFHFKRETQLIVL